MATSTKPIIGNNTPCGERSIYGKFSAINNPHSGLGDFTPIPIKLSEVKLRVITGKRSKA